MSSQAGHCFLAQQVRTRTGAQPARRTTVPQGRRLPQRCTCRTHTLTCAHSLGPPAHQVHAARFTHVMLACCGLCKCAPQQGPLRTNLGLRVLVSKMGKGRGKTLDACEKQAHPTSQPDQSLYVWVNPENNMSICQMQGREEEEGRHGARGNQLARNSIAADGSHQPM